MKWKNKTAGACHPLADDVEIFFVVVIRLLFESKQKCHLCAFAKCMHLINMLFFKQTKQAGHCGMFYGSVIDKVSLASEVLTLQPTQT